MPDVSFENLLVIFAVAVVVPLLGGAPRLRIPIGRAEILVGC